MPHTKSISSARVDAPVGQLGAWKELACGLVNTLASHSFRWKDADYQEFRQALVAAMEVLQNQPSASSVLAHAEILSQRIEQYQRGAEQLVDSSVSGLNDVVRILVSSAEKARAEDEAVVRELQQMEETIRSARTAEELQAARAHLVHAVDKLKRQTLDRNQTAAHLMTGVQERMSTLERSSGAGAQAFRAEPVKSSASPPLPVPSSNGNQPAGPVDVTWDVASVRSQLDSVTGLPGQAAAEAAILALRPEDRPNYYVVALWLRRMGAVQARFGEKLCNELLLFCAQQIAQSVILATDRLFRWRGQGSFVAFLRREDPLLNVRQEIGRTLASNRMAFESTNGALLIPMNVSSHVMSASAHGCPELIEGLEKFFSLAAAQG